MYHEQLFKLSIVHYWERFSVVVDQEFLWAAIKGITAKDLFLFHSDGRPFNPPASIEYMVRKERERMIILSIGNHSKPLPTAIVIAICVGVAISTFLITTNKRVQQNFSKVYNSLVVEPTKLLHNMGRSWSGGAGGGRVHIIETKRRRTRQ